MSPPRWPSLDVPESQKRAFSEADVRALRDEIDDAIFDLFDIGAPSREAVRRFYRTAGRVAGGDQAASE